MPVISFPSSSASQSANQLRPRFQNKNFNLRIPCYKSSGEMSYSEATEIQLVQALTKGDPAAFREIYERYQGMVFLFAFRLTKSKDTADDVVQELFAKIWEQRQSIRIEKNFEGYLRTITRNLIMDFFRKAARSRELQAKLIQNMQSLQQTHVEELIERELRRLHQQAIERLSPQRKKVYLLSREEEMSYDEIASHLGISKHTVRNQIASSIKSIREYLASHSEFAFVILAGICLALKQ